MVRRICTPEAMIQEAMIPLTLTKQVVLLMGAGQWLYLRNK